MPETTESETQAESGKDVINELCDAVRYIGDVIRSLIDKDIEWVNARVAGGDRLREEWKDKWNCDKSEGAPEPIN